MNTLETPPVAFNVFEPFDSVSLNQDRNNHLESSNYQGENSGYSLFGNPAFYEKKLGGNENQPQRNISCTGLQKKSLNQPFSCVIQNPLHSPEPLLSWSQVVAHTSDSSEGTLLEDKSTSIDVPTTDFSLFNEDTPIRTNKKYISDSTLANVEARNFSPTPSLPSYVVIKVTNVRYMLFVFYNKSY